jgi:integrase
MTKAEIASHLLKLKADHGPIAANRSRATLRAMYAWAESIGRIEAMPPFPPKVLKREPTRERVLSLDELRSIWSAAGDGNHGAIVRLLMLSGQRREEVGGMRWSELDLERALWRLAGARTKNKLPHVVPLSWQAVALISAQSHRPGRDNIFGNGAGSYSGWSRSKARLDGRCGVAGWTLHDLRRSWATHVAKLTGRVDVVEMALNHRSGVLGGVAGTYIRETFLEERARAMQTWADHLLAAVQFDG